jgi:hypothetical protein
MFVLLKFISKEKPEALLSYIIWPKPLKMFKGFELYPLGIVSFFQNLYFEISNFFKESSFYLL